MLGENLHEHAVEAPLVVEIDVSGDGPSELLVNPHFFEVTAGSVIRVQWPRQADPDRTCAKFSRSKRKLTIKTVLTRQSRLEVASGSDDPSRICESSGAEMSEDIRRSLSPLVNVPAAQHGLIFELAALAPKDCFLDVGCGPGHVAISACLHHPTITAIGIDVRRDYLREAQENARLAAVEGRVEFLHYDLAALARAPFLTRATVIYMYLMPKAIEVLEPVLLQAIQRGARVVTFFTNSSGHLRTIQHQGEALMGLLRLYCQG